MGGIPYTLQWAALYPPQNCSFPRDSESPPKTWFLEPTRVHSPNGISIGSAVFAELTIVTDSQTDHASTRSVTIGSIYVHSTAMRPHNNHNNTQLINRVYQQPSIAQRRVSSSSSSSSSSCIKASSFRCRKLIDVNDVSCSSTNLHVWRAGVGLAILID